jgi:hypothetical protein
MYRDIPPHPVLRHKPVVRGVGDEDDERNPRPHGDLGRDRREHRQDCRAGNAHPVHVHDDRARRVSGRLHHRVTQPAGTRRVENSVSDHHGGTDVAPPADLEPATHRRSRPTRAVQRLAQVVTFRSSIWRVDPSPCMNTTHATTLIAE